MGLSAGANPSFLTTYSSNSEKDREISEAVERFKRDGYFIWYKVLDPAFLRELSRAYSNALEKKVERFALKPNNDARTQEAGAMVLNDFRPSGGNHDLNRWNMHLASRKPLFDERVFADRRIVSVVEELMGTGCVCYLIASDTPYPGATLQAAHQDFSRFSIAVNIPLVDCVEENAPLEVWPGTHCPKNRSQFAEFSVEQYAISPQGMRQIVSDELS
jgi:ectoine hydroxylase-related dioxygenase (phytanoyl-CoA dioxygenase family)